MFVCFCFLIGCSRGGDTKGCYKDKREWTFSSFQKPYVCLGIMWWNDTQNPYDYTSSSSTDVIHSCCTLLHRRIWLSLQQSSQHSQWWEMCSGHSPHPWWFCRNHSVSQRSDSTATRGWLSVLLKGAQPLCIILGFSYTPLHLYGCNTKSQQ